MAVDEAGQQQLAGAVNHLHRQVRPGGDGVPDGTDLTAGQKYVLDTQRLWSIYGCIFDKQHVFSLPSCFIPASLEFFSP